MLDENFPTLPLHRDGGLGRPGPGWFHHGRSRPNVDPYQRPVQRMVFRRRFGDAPAGSDDVAVANPGPIYTSSDSGLTWHASDAPPTNWWGVASSTNGQNLVAAANPGGIYTSSDGGATWVVTSAPSGQWYDVASSADGTQLAAQTWITAGQGGGSGLTEFSTNSGKTWTSIQTPNAFWSCLAASWDGSLWFAGTDEGAICTSAGSGFDWLPSESPTGLWNAIASSADGSKLVAATEFGGPLYVSADSGATWNDNGSPVGPSWTSVATSSDGVILVACASQDDVGNGGNIYISTNSGTVWVPAGAPTRAWRGVASSADGTKLVAVDSGGGIYTLQTSSTPPPPSLQCVLSGNGALVSWPSSASSAGWALWQTPSLSAPSWAASGDPVVTSGSLSTVTVTPPAGTLYFQLRHP